MQEFRNIRFQNNYKHLYCNSWIYKTRILEYLNEVKYSIYIGVREYKNNAMQKHKKQNTFFQKKAIHLWEKDKMGI